MAGQKQVDPDQNHIFCLSESPFSNTIPVQAPAAPKSPELRLESMTPQGIRVTWLAPQQYGEAEISVSTASNVVSRSYSPLAFIYGP